MKKIKFLAVIAAFVTASVLAQEKQLIVKGEIQNWQLVMEVIEQSNAPHLQVKAAQEFLLKQLQPQLQDTTKSKMP